MHHNAAAASRRAPAAAASFAPASSGLPSSSHLPLQMRESPGYAPVLSDAAPWRVSRTPPRPEVAADDLAGLTSGPRQQVISLVLITVN